MCRLMKIFASMIFVLVICSLLMLSGEEIEFEKVVNAAIKDDFQAVDADGNVACSHSYKWVGVKIPTCTKTGIREYKCTKCNYVSKTETLAAQGHNYSYTESDSVWHSMICSRCKNEILEKHTMDGNDCTKCEYNNACQHSYKVGDCVTPDICSKCGDIYAPAPGHNYAAATCTSPKTCTRCSATYGDALGHNYVEATCSTAKKCTRCNTSIGGPLGHSYAAATCTKPKTCTRCSVTYGDALGHSYAVATCTKPKTCTRCNVTYGDALGHNYVEATCSTAKKCTRCNTSIGGPLGHSYAAATCTKPKTCTRCNATTGEVLAHTYNIKAGKFYNDTYHYERYKCSCGEPTYINYQKHILDDTGRCVYACGYAKEIQTIECNHTYSWVTVKEATCKETGIKENKCTKCGKVEKTETISKKEHDYKNATCTEPKICKICGATSGKAPGHSFNIKGETKFDSKYHYEIWKCLCGESEKRNQQEHTLVKDKCECGFTKTHEHKFEKSENKFDEKYHYEIWNCWCGASENRNQKTHTLVKDKCSCGYEANHQHKFEKKENSYDEKYHYEIWNCWCGASEKRNQKTHTLVKDKCSCGYEANHQHKFEKKENSYDEKYHYEIWNCWCGESEKRNQQEHTLVDYKCKCGFKVEHQHNFVKSEIKYDEKQHYEIWKCSCGASEKRNQGNHTLINNRCECGYVFVCKHNDKKKIEYVYKNIEEHTSKTICEKCNEVIKEESKKHNNTLIEIKSINEQRHTKTMQCIECNKKYYLEGNHTFNTKNMCECGFVKENEEITATKIVFENTKNNSYTIKVGETIRLLEKIKITPANAKTDLKFMIVSGSDGVVTLETYTGKLEAKKVFTEGIKVRVVDRISEKFAEVTIKIEKNPTANEESETVPPNFEDIEDGAWYEDDVNNAVQDGLFNGTSENTFSPNSPITRGMFVTVLARMDKADIENFANVFDDVSEGAYYQESISWAVANGIVNGVGDGKFAPDAQITREAMAVILYNYINISHKGLLQGTTNTEQFADQNEIASWAIDEVRALKAIGLINGKTGGNYKPKDVVTRAEGAVILQRLSEMIKSDIVVNKEKCSANIVVSGHREKLVMTYEFVTNDVHARKYRCDICKTEWQEKTMAHSFENAKCICGHICVHNGSKITEQGYNAQNKLVERTICENCKYVISEKLIVTNTTNYSPSDFSQYKPVMDKNSYTDADWDRMEAELKARVEKAGFGTRAGVVEAALYLASLDYALPYRGTPMQESADIGFYSKYGMNRTWGRTVKLTQNVVTSKTTYKKGTGVTNGMDCIRFVTWAFVNGGVINPGDDEIAYKTNNLTQDKGSLSDRMKRELEYSNLRAHPLKNVVDEVEPGDIIYTYGTRNGKRNWTHIGLIVGVDDDNIYVAESNTTTYSPDTESHSLTVNKLVVTRIPKTYSKDVLGFVVLCDDTIYKAKNPDGTENKGNMPQVWGN